jgi:hypothetical protein
MSEQKPIKFQSSPPNNLESEIIGDISPDNILNQPIYEKGQKIRSPPPTQIEEEEDTFQEEQQIPQELSLEEKKERLVLKRDIKMYKASHLGKLYLQEYDISSLELMSTQQLRDLRAEVEFAVSVGSSSAISSKIILSSIGAYEGFAIGRGIQCQGLTQILSQQTEMQMLCEEIALKYSNVSNINPLLKLGSIIFITSYQLHKINSSKNILGDFLIRNVDKKIVDEFNDL